MFFGDIHGSVRQMYKLAKKWEESNDRKINGIVQVGDFGVYPNNITDWSSMWEQRIAVPYPTLAIMGNHEDPKTIMDWMAEPDRIPDLHLLSDGCVNRFLGVEIGGVYGNFSPKSYMNPERVRQNRWLGGNSAKIGMHIYQPSVNLLMNYDGPLDVLITHDSARVTFPEAFRRPMDPFISDQLGLERAEINHAQGCPGFDDLLKKHQPKYYFYGHLHGSSTCQVGRTHCELLNAIQYSNEPYKVVEFS